MLKKYIALILLIVVVGAATSGCFDMFGGSSPNATMPPEQVFTNDADLAKAVAQAKADTTATDVQNLKGLTVYYALTTPPSGAQISYIKISVDTVRVGYAFGEEKADSYDNKMEVTWYRNVDATKYLSNLANSLGTYDTVTQGGNNYLRITPPVQVIVTAAPGSASAAPTPTPRTSTYCQFAYWVQDGVALVASVPLGFSDQDIGKYCQVSKHDLK